MSDSKLDYALAPVPGSTAAQRKASLDEAKFIGVRNLAYLIYKKKDNTPLMSYHETLDDREKVKMVILEHEIALGLVIADGTEKIVVKAAPLPIVEPIEEEEEEGEGEVEMATASEALPVPPAVPPPAVPPKVASPPMAQAAPPPAPPRAPRTRRGLAGHVAPIASPAPSLPTPARSPVPSVASPGPGAGSDPQQAERLKEIEAGLGKIAELILQESKARYAQVAQVEQTLSLVLTALHHLYINSQVGLEIGDKIETREDFIAYLKGYQPSPQ